VLSSLLVLGLLAVLLLLLGLAVLLRLLGLTILLLLHGLLSVLLRLLGLTVLGLLHGLTVLLLLHRLLHLLRLAILLLGHLAWIHLLRLLHWLLLTGIAHRLLHHGLLHHGLLHHWHLLLVTHGHRRCHLLLGHSTHLRSEHHCGGVHGLLHLSCRFLLLLASDSWEPLRLEMDLTSRLSLEGDGEPVIHTTGDAEG